MAKPNAVLDTRGAQASTGAMQVQVSGKHVDVGDALRERVTDEITTSIGKYFERGGDADVVVSREGHSFRVDCAVQLASGQQLRSHGLGGDAHAAFGAALQKVETRIRRYKRKLKSHSNAANAKAAETAFAWREASGGGLFTVLVRGSVGSVKAATDAGAEAARRVGELVTVHVIPKPDPQLDAILPRAPGRSSSRRPLPGRG